MSHKLKDNLRNQLRARHGRAVSVRAAILMCTLLVIATHSGAAADLMVNPTRIVFEGRTRSADLVLVNQGSSPATYRVSFIQMRMADDGQLVRLPAEEEPLDGAEQMVRYSPRQVVLEPGVAQIIRLLLRKPAGLEPGEYRSHLLLRGLPEESTADIESIQLEDRQVEIRLSPVYGVAVPVIVRHGTLTASADLEGLRLVGDQPVGAPGGDSSASDTTGAVDVSGAPEMAIGQTSPSEVAFTIRRDGTRSIYGDLTLTHVTDRGERTVVGRARGIAVYLPLTQRESTLPIEPPPGHELTEGRLVLELQEPPGTIGRITATQTIDIL